MKKIGLWIAIVICAGMVGNGFAQTALAGSNYSNVDISAEWKEFLQWFSENEEKYGTFSQWPISEYPVVFEKLDTLESSFDKMGFYKLALPEEGLDEKSRIIDALPVFYNEESDPTTAKILAYQFAGFSMLSPESKAWYDALACSTGRFNGATQYQEPKDSALSLTEIYAIAVGALETQGDTSEAAAFFASIAYFQEEQDAYWKVDFFHNGLIVHTLYLSGEGQVMHRGGEPGKASYFPYRYYESGILARDDAIYREMKHNEAASGQVISLYYNEDGGSYYHENENCATVNPAYLPMNTFLSMNLQDELYTRLQPCTRCCDLSFR